MSAPTTGDVVCKLFNFFDQSTIQRLSEVGIHLHDPRRTEINQWRLGLVNGGAPWQREAKKTLDASEIVFVSIQTSKGNGGSVLQAKFDPETSKTKKKGVRVDPMQVINDALKVHLLKVI